MEGPMKRTVFYSWQSDLPGRGNRNLIEESLGRAIRAIARNNDAGVEPVLDRDTADLAGTPDIAHSILAKIAMADAFVADVSIVNGADGGRATPNPNVLIELGYAVAELGWDNVVLVQNTAYGGPERLPFDLRGRRTVTYEMGPEGDLAATRGLLQGRLESVLRTSLATGPGQGLPSGEDAPLWWGRWTFDPGPTAGGVLFIREIGARGFLFDLDVFNGAHQGSITAYARILSSDVAYCRVPNGPGDPDGELVFRRRHGEGVRSIDIEAAGCSYHGGARAHFGGRFVRGNEPWFDRGFLNELELARLYSLVGEWMTPMRDCTSDIGEDDSLENESIRVIWGGVAGLYTEMQSIVMVDAAGQMWAAFIDGPVVRYFTNVPQYRQRLPRTIDAWRDGFRDKEVVYCEPVRTVPVPDDEAILAAAMTEPVPAEGAPAPPSSRLRRLLARMRSKRR